MTGPRPFVPRLVAHLGPFVDARILTAADVQVAAAVARHRDDDPDVVLAAALVSRALRIGQVGIVLGDVAASVTTDDAAPDAITWPDADRWTARLGASPAVSTTTDFHTGVEDHGDSAAPPDRDDVEGVPLLVFDGVRLAFDRYRRFEARVADDLRRRASAGGGLVPPGPDLDAALDARFGTRDAGQPDRQREAVRAALTRRLVVIAGGPGTGKTFTLAALLATLRELTGDGAPSVALAAPTGKAAARLTEAVRSGAERLHSDPPASMPEATTIHRLLGADRSGRPRRDRTDPLPHDLVVVDEMSMVALALLARLLDAVRPEASVVLVGDPFQLASVEAGAVFGEIVGPGAARARPSAGGPLSDSVVVLDRVHRFRADEPIAQLADAVRTGDSAIAIAVLRAADRQVTWIEPGDAGGVAAVTQAVDAAAADVMRAARAGASREALDHATRVKLLAATHHGPLGTRAWTERTEVALAEQWPDADLDRRWYVGRPVMVTRNDYTTRLFNGDVGITIAAADGPRVAFPDPNAPGGWRSLPPAQLGDVETWWAMTIHKSQGSEFDHVIVTLPDASSPILSRELLYTAVTRARDRLTVVASEDSLRAAIDRPAPRTSGLGAMLWPGPARG